MSKRLVVSAVVFDRFNHDAAQLNGAFRDGVDVSKAVATGAAYDPEQFRTGMIAYAAFAALREASFIDGVRKAAADAPSRDAFIAEIAADPTKIARIAGAQEAAGRIRAALQSEVSGSRSAGLALKQASYDIQRQAWSQKPVAEPQARLERAKSLSQVATDLDQVDEARLPQMYDALAQAGSAGGAQTPVVQRALALAALAVLGRAGDGDDALLDQILADEPSAFCLKMAKLNYFQCLSVAGPNYEDVFCLGTHAIAETTKCVQAAADLDLPLPVSEPPRRPSGMMVPIAALETAAR